MQQQATIKPYLPLSYCALRLPHFRAKLPPLALPPTSLPLLCSIPRHAEPESLHHSQARSCHLCVSNWSHAVSALCTNAP
jgi:hypothetical protein